MTILSKEDLESIRGTAAEYEHLMRRHREASAGSQEIANLHATFKARERSLGRLAERGLFSRIAAAIDAARGKPEPPPKQCDAEACEQGCACPGDCISEHRTPFNVTYGPRTAYGQIATGYVVGVRLPDMDVLLFGATADEARTAAGRLGGEVFGESMIDKRAMLIREAAAS